MKAAPDPAWLRQRVEGLDGHLYGVKRKIDKLEERLDAPQLDSERRAELRERLSSLVREKQELLKQQRVLTVAIANTGTCLGFEVVCMQEAC
jgi:hypothetical protein